MTETDWETMIVSRLTTKAEPLHALVGDRVHPLRLPQTPTLPAIVYTVIDDPDRWGHHGFARVQVTAWAATYATAKAVITAARAQLRGYAGATVTDRIEDIDVDLGAWAGFDPDLGLYRRDLDVIILHINKRQ